MTFRQPWAWIGLLAILLPVAAHLLARRPARRQAFPHLRFLPAAAIKPVRRDRLADPALLTLRGAIVAAAAAALTQPLFVIESRTRDRETRLARAIVIDATVEVDAARREAAEASRGAAAVRTGEVDDVRAGLTRALDWLGSQSMRRELVVISDFRQSRLTRADVDAVPAAVGITLRSVPGGGSPSSGPQPSTPGVEFRPRGATAEAARDAALAGLGHRVARKDRPVTVVFTGTDEPVGRRPPEQPLDRSWMSEVYFAVLDDPLVRSAAARLDKRPGDLVTAARGLDADAGRLLLLLHEPPHTVAAAAVIAAAWKSISTDSQADADALAEPLRTRAELDAWQRPPGPPPAGPPPAGESDGRWMWIVALALLGAETLVRRRRTRLTTTGAPDVRVA
jgi:hypothetical protein